MRAKRFVQWSVICCAGIFLFSTPAMAAVEAICVPWESNQGLPHSSYNGATVRLKAIARGHPVEFRWDFGDGSPATPWTPVGNPYVLEAIHTYTGLPGSQYIATLYVRDGSGAEDTDTYVTLIQESSDLSIPDHVDVRINMAIDEGLWWLHKNMVRGDYSAAAPGYGEPYGYWVDSYPVAATGAAVDAFQLFGSKANGDYDGDPYIETVQRALNYLLYNTYAFGIGPQAAGDPDSLDNNIGLVTNRNGNRYDTRQTYIGGIGLVALASSGAPNRIATVGRTHVYGRPYHDIVQDMVDFFAWGQVDAGSGRGGWRYYANYSNSDMSTTQWPPLGMLSAEQNMGSIVPQFVRDELVFFLNYTQHTACDTYHGGFGYSFDINYPNCTKAGAGIISHEFIGTPLDDRRVESALGYLYRHWNDTSGSWTNQRLLGNSYGMYGVMKALRLPQPDITHIYEYDCNAQTANSFDWYYEPAAEGREGLAQYLVRTQFADGSWDDVPGPNPVYNAFATGWRVLILLPGVTIQPPRAVICDCDEQEYNLNQDIHLDGACAYHPDETRSVVTYEWDLDYDLGGFDVDATGTEAMIPGGFPTTGYYPVGMRVTDDNPDYLGGAQTDIGICEVYVHPPPHCPHAFAGGPYQGFIGTPLSLDASASWDPDNAIAAYDWDLDNDGLFGAEDSDCFGEPSDAVGLSPQWTWNAPYLGVIGLRVTDAAGEFEPCSDYDYSTVEIGNHTPVSDPNGPYDAYIGDTITLDGTGSYDIDPGDTIILYEWDLDNDGTFFDCSGPICPFTAGTVVGMEHVVCLRVTDSFGEYDIACTTVTVIDNREPVARCQDVTVSAGFGCLGDATPDDVDDGSYDPDGDMLDFMLEPPGPYPLSDTDVTLIVSDGFLSDSCTAVVTVIDDTPPDLTCPADLWLECPADTDPLATGTATAVDNCGSSFFGYDDFPVASCGDTGSLDRQWFAGDPSGNTTTCNQMITVLDTIPPLLVPPPPATMECMVEGGIPIDDPRVGSWLTSAVATNTCGGVSVTHDAPALFPEGATTVSFTAIDACGNVTVDTSTLTATDCHCTPEPLSQGYWHRQCLGAGLITPGRQGRGPTTVPEPDFTKTLVPAVDEMLQMTVFAFRTCEDGMDALPPSAPRERALKQYTAMLLNLTSDRLHNVCSLDLTTQGCDSTILRDLVGELAGMINSGNEPIVKQAASCAAALNQNEGIVPGMMLAAPPVGSSALGDVASLVAPAGTTSSPAETAVTGTPSDSASTGASGMAIQSSAPDPAGTPDVPQVTGSESTDVAGDRSALLLGAQPTADAGPAGDDREAAIGTVTAPGPFDPLREVSRHLAVLTDAGAPEETRRIAEDALLTALSGGYDADVRLRIANTLVDNVDVAYHSLILKHLESIRDEAMVFGRPDLERKTTRLIERLRGMISKAR